MKLPQQWAEYARLQLRSSRNSKVDSYSWGLEEEMNLFLDGPDEYTPAVKQRLKRANASTARRERCRASMRKLHGAELASQAIDAITQHEARECLALIGSKVTAAQWDLVSAVGRGEGYADISSKQGITVGAARAQMFRLRQQFAHLRPVA